MGYSTMEHYTAIKRMNCCYIYHIHKFHRRYVEQKKPEIKEKILCDSISMTFTNRQNRSMVVGAGIVVASRWLGGGGRKLTVREPEVLEIFYILMWVVVTWVCTYVKGH